MAILTVRIVYVPGLGCTIKQVGISETICVAEDFLAGYSAQINRRRIKEHRKHNDGAKKSSRTQRMVAEILT